MKIAIDATPVAHGNRAVRRHTKNLIETLLRLDSANDYKLLYIDFRRKRSRYCSIPTSPRISEYVVSIPGRFLKPPWQYLGLPKSEWLIGPFDIFYATDLYFPPTTRGLVLGSVRGLAYQMIENKLDPREVSLLRKGLDYSLKHADYLLAVSYKTREELIEEFGVPNERIYVVRHGIDARFRRIENPVALSKRLQKKLGHSSPYILFVGVIGYHKNIMNLLNAHQILWNQGIRLPLVLAGPPGSAWQEAQRWVTNENREKYVQFLGLVDQDSAELTDLYNGAALFVFPSFYEGWSTPPLEAMACGTPVITSNCSSLPETVGNAALQIDPNDVEELAHVMEKVLSDQALRYALIKRGLEHVALHTWENAAKKLIEVFTDIQLKGPWTGRRNESYY
jgi:glycosyltransferase involved in cell wall biosynthesis